MEGDTLIIKHRAEDGITRWHVVDIPSNTDPVFVKNIMNNYYYRFMVLADPMDSSRHLNGIHKYTIAAKKSQFVPRDSWEYEIVEELRKFYNCKYDLVYVSGADDLCKYEIEKIKRKRGNMSLSVPPHDIYIESSH
jgi:hypothetical protein